MVMLVCKYEEDSQLMLNVRGELVAFDRGLETVQVNGPLSSLRMLEMVSTFRSSLSSRWSVATRDSPADSQLKVGLVPDAVQVILTVSLNSTGSVTLAFTCTSEIGSAVQGKRENAEKSVYHTIYSTTPTVFPYLLHTADTQSHNLHANRPLKKPVRPPCTGIEGGKNFALSLGLLRNANSDHDEDK